MRVVDLKEPTLLRRAIRILIGVAIGLGLLAGGIWVLIHTLGEREALYQGKSLYYWSEQIKSQNTAASNQASLVLNQEIIPRLTKTMFEDTSDSRLRVALVENLNGLPGVNILFRMADGRRGGAAAAFGEFGPPAEAAVPALLQALQGHDLVVRRPAAVSLGKIHAKPGVIIPLLIRYLEEDDLRESAAEALGEFGGLSKAAIPRLLSLLKVPDKDLHTAVEEALKDIDPDAAAQAGVRIGARSPSLPKTNDH
jgi:HEAT repeat protein